MQPYLAFDEQRNDVRPPRVSTPSYELGQVLLGPRFESGRQYAQPLELVVRLVALVDDVAGQELIVAGQEVYAQQRLVHEGMVEGILRDGLRAEAHSPPGYTGRSPIYCRRGH